MTRTLDSGCQISLALRTVARLFAGFDATTISDKSPDACNIFVVNGALFAVALASTSGSAAAEWWAACVTLSCSGGCHFLPRGKDSRTIRQLAKLVPHGNCYQGSSSTSSDGLFTAGAG